MEARGDILPFFKGRVSLAILFSGVRSDDETAASLRQVREPARCAGKENEESVQIRESIRVLLADLGRSQGYQRGVGGSNE